MAINRDEEATEGRTDEGKTSSGMGIKRDFSSKKEASKKKADMASRMKGGKGMPYTMSTQKGGFEEGRGMHAKMWGSRPSESRGGGMPVKMWGGDGKMNPRKKSDA